MDDTPPKFRRSERSKPLSKEDAIAVVKGEKKLPFALGGDGPPDFVSMESSWTVVAHWFTKPVTQALEAGKALKPNRKKARR